MINDRDIDSVMMNIKGSSGSIMTAALLPARLTFKLATFLFRLAKEGLVSAGMLDKFQKFSNDTGGKYTAYNVPLSEENAKKMVELQKLELQLDKTKNPLEQRSIRKNIESIQNSIPEIAQLNKLGISYCALPKLNGSEQTIQIAVANSDDQMFKTWFGNHLVASLSSGGVKNLESIKVFTEGNYSILNMPFEEAKELGEMMSDFNTMHINYAVLPDLNVGDGYTQVAIPNAERGQVEQWFKLWKEQALSNGEEPGDMFTLNPDSYMNTASVSPEEYINTADAQYQNVQNMYEAQSQEVPWAAAPGKENSESFIKYSQDERFENITINKESLVENQGIPEQEIDALKKKGIFASRVPGTYGENEETLLVPMERVFSTDDGKTYIAFLDKTSSDNMIRDNKNNQIKSHSTEAIKEKYDTVNRGFKKVESMQKAPSLTKDLAKNISAPKIDFNL